MSTSVGIMQLHIFCTVYLDLIIGIKYFVCIYAYPKPYCMFMYLLFDTQFIYS